MLEAVGVADGDDELSGPKRLRVAELDGGEVGRRDADDGDVAVAVLADEVCRALAAVGERDVDRRGAVDDVAVGEDEAVVGEDEAGAAARLRARPLRGARRADVDADDGRGDALDRVDDRPGVGVEELVVRRLEFAGGEVPWSCS